jgi:hypothetical protein
VPCCLIRKITSSNYAAGKPLIFLDSDEKREEKKSNNKRETLIDKKNKTIVVRGLPKE